MQRNREYASKLSIMQTTVERRPQPRAVSHARRPRCSRRVGATRPCGTSGAPGKMPATSFVLGIDFIAEGTVRCRRRGARALPATGADASSARSTHANHWVVLTQRSTSSIEPRHTWQRSCGSNRDGARLMAIWRSAVAAGPRGRGGCEQFQFASDLQPGNPDALRLLGIAQAQTGQLDAAVVTFKRAIELDPLSGRAITCWGRRWRPRAGRCGRASLCAQPSNWIPRMPRHGRISSAQQGYVR